MSVDEVHARLDADDLDAALAVLHRERYTNHFGQWAAFIHVGP